MYYHVKLYCLKVYGFMIGITVTCGYYMASTQNFLPRYYFTLDV